LTSNRVASVLESVAWAVDGKTFTTVIDGDNWSHLPSRDVEVQAFTDKTVTLRYRPSDGWPCWPLNS
jgi:hypothetical protein